MKQVVVLAQYNHMDQYLPARFIPTLAAYVMLLASCIKCCQSRDKILVTGIGPYSCTELP